MNKRGGLTVLTCWFCVLNHQLLFSAELWAVSKDSDDTTNMVACVHPGYQIAPAQLASKPRCTQLLGWWLSTRDTFFNGIFMEFQKIKVRTSYNEYIYINININIHYMTNIKLELTNQVAWLVLKTSAPHMNSRRFRDPAGWSYWHLPCNDYPLVN